jgi:hypothetical protein
VIRWIRPCVCCRCRTTSSPRPTPAPTPGAGSPSRRCPTIGQAIDPTEWNRNDGFSPGSMVLTFVPNLDLPVTWGTQAEPTSLPGIGPNEPGYFDHRDHIAAPGRYLQSDAPIVILDADSGERHPFWSELDQHPNTSADQRLLILRPAVNFEEGHRYIVALRDLKRSDGSTIAPDPTFEGYRRPHGVALRHARRGGHRSRRPLPGLGLHGGQ